MKLPVTGFEDVSPLIVEASSVVSGSSATHAQLGGLRPQRGVRFGSPSTAVVR